MTTFHQYINHLDEMARVKDSEKFYLPDGVLSYLKHFIQEPKEKTDKNKTRWGVHIDPEWTFRWFRQALMKLFDNKLLTSVSPPSTLSGILNTSDKHFTNTKTFKDVPIDIPALKASMEEKNLDPEKMHMDRQMAGTTAQKTVDWLLGKNEPPFISAKHFQKDYVPPSERGTGHQYSKPEEENP